jgi:spermidine synthase
LRALLISLGTVSAAAIGAEILLMRLYAIVQWHHFASMIISGALLGFGASGTFLALARRWLASRFGAAFLTSAALFGLSVVGSFALTLRVPFNPLELLWDLRQPLHLFRVYLLLALPFFCAANCVALALMRFPDEIPRIYRANLVGSGLGAVGIVLALFALPPEACLRGIGALGFLAAALAARDPSIPPRRGLPWVFVLLAAAAAGAWPSGWIAARPSPYKGLSLALQVEGAEIVHEASSPLGRITAVRNDTVPFRDAPGLSLETRGDVPAQIALFSDGAPAGVITRDDGRPGALATLGDQTAALPYPLLARPEVLVLGAGGGAEVLRARVLGARRIDAVELNPQIVAAVRGPFRDFAGNLYGAPGVRVHVAEARGFVEGREARVDLIQIALLESFGASAAGLHALHADSLHTVEAFDAYLAHLRKGGLLAVTRWLQIPPRDSLKLFATAVAALERSGVADPGRSLVLVRSFRTTTLLVKKGAFTGGEIAALRAFCEARAFDVAWHPGIRAAETNRFNLLEEPYLFEGAKALLGPGREAFLARYKFHLAPATDDRPYFFRFLKWRTLPEILALRGRGGMPLVEWGTLVLLATLLQAGVAGLALILLPLRALPRAGGPARLRGRVAVYFLALGLAFLFVEIAFIQRFTLFLSHPLYAVAVVLAAFLVFAGLGSGFSARLARRHAPGAGLPIALAVGGIVLVSAVYLLLLPPLFRAWMPLPDPAKVALSLALIAPLAFCMGMPFPLGLSRVAALAPALVPWAWGINGCASVLSAVLATLLALHVGFTGVIVLALGLYALAAVTLRALGRKA